MTRWLEATAFLSLRLPGASLWRKLRDFNSRQNEKLASGGGNEGDRKLSLRNDYLRSGGRSNNRRGLPLHRLPKADRHGVPRWHFQLARHIRLKSGTPKTYLKIAESGNKRCLAFCSECGSPIYSVAAEPNPSIYGLRVGGLDQRGEFSPPKGQIWCRSALSWSMDISGAKLYERG